MLRNGVLFYRKTIPLILNDYNYPFVFIKTLEPSFPSSFWTTKKCASKVKIKSGLFYFKPSCWHPKERKGFRIVHHQSSSLRQSKGRRHGDITAVLSSAGCRDI